MANSKVEKSHRRSERLWIPILLLLFGQFFSITPALLIVLANEQSRRATDLHLALVSAIDRVALDLSQQGGKDREAWQQRYTEDRAELGRLLEGTTGYSAIQSVVEGLPGDAAELQNARALATDLANAEGPLRTKLAAERRNIGQWNT
ncbi:MAG TPA: hypothetical protein VFE51_22835, partial [Verrucomicrobiae bacterium]|nr:hypothetical protein [Verrucomicrobiae bacterium]